MVYIIIMIDAVLGLTEGAGSDMLSVFGRKDGTGREMYIRN